MKKMILVGVLALASALLGFQTRAQTATGTFDVVINLTSKCEINSTATATGAVVTNLTFNYTSFQIAAATGAGGGFNVRCTNTLPYTMALDNSGATDNAVQLAYTLGLSAVGATGTGVNQPHSVTGSMAGGQAGNCVGGVCNNSVATNKTKTLTITY